LNSIWTIWIREWPPSSRASTSGSKQSSAKSPASGSPSSSFRQDGGFRTGRGRKAGSGGRTAARSKNALANLQRYVDGKAAAEDQLRKLLADPQLMQALKSRTVEQGGDSEEVSAP